MKELKEKIKFIIKMNIDFVSKLNGINKEDCEKFPEAVAQQITQMLSEGEQIGGEYENI